MDASSFHGCIPHLVLHDVQWNCCWSYGAHYPWRLGYLHGWKQGLFLGSYQKAQSSDRIRIGKSLLLLDLPQNYCIPFLLVSQRIHKQALANWLMVYDSLLVLVFISYGFCPFCYAFVLDLLFDQICHCITF